MSKFLKRLFLPGMPIFLLVTMAACAPQTVQPDVATERGLTIFHINDVYRIDAVEDGTAGGLGRVATLVREAEASGHDVRITHGGDFLYPSLESQLWDGMQMVDALNFLDALAPLYVVIGNHETDRKTSEHLVDAVRASNFDWLGDNYRFLTGDPEVDESLHSGFMFDYEGQKIGVFAVTLHGDDGGNSRDYVPVDPDYLAAAESAITELEKNGASLIFGLTHLHLWEDEEIAKLKAQHPTFRFIVGGHEHEPEFVAASKISASVMKGASNARAIWRIDLDLDDNGVLQVARTEAIRLNEKIASDAAYDQLAGKWRARMLEKFPFLTARVGVAALPMDAREAFIRNQESPWGDFIVDQMRRAFGAPDADFAFINSGTLRLDDVVSGDILFEDIGRTFGFSSMLRILELSGAEFRTLLEAGYRGDGPSQGYFPQVSGFRVCVDFSRDAGERIVSMQVPDGGAWHEIEPARNYSVVVPDFLYGGGDGYRFPPGRKASRPASELKYLVLDGIMALQAEGKQVGTPVDPVNPRIRILSDAVNRCW
ncbi:MAG TPA: 5'-nucleotidase C-terminal domain-containing protein [Woeseiaceae bacterium]|nr:5'-nucleotidase C-terminal domain-containing protein [Woeseiaceae bacterium]